MEAASSESCLLVGFCGFHTTVLIEAYFWIVDRWKGEGINITILFLHLFSANGEI
jgi:hypothetical protein